jgi:CopG family transcriptional regulator/antitoxin EndoAI
MGKTRTKSHKRIDITLPEATVRLIDRVADKGTRSYFIDQAIHFYVSTQSRQNLRNQLKEGALQRTQRDLQLAEDWFDIENELWREKKAK